MTVTDDADARIKVLQEEAAGLVALVDDEGRAFSEDERARVDAIFDEAKALRQGRQPLDPADLAGLAGPLGRPPYAPAAPPAGKARATRAATHPWTKAVLAHQGGDPHAYKALDITGSVSVPSVLAPGIFPEGRPGTPIASLCAQADLTTGGEFTYFQAGPRDSQAATVPHGALKPTTDIPLVRKTGHASTIAHLTSAYRQDLADLPSLNAYITAELLWGVAEELDAQIVNGDGTQDATHDNMTGILNTPGIGAVPWDTDILRTTRHAVTVLTKLGYAPNAWAISPEDDEALDLLADANDRPFGNGPFAAGPTTLWSLRRVVSNAVPVGKAILGQWNLAIVAVRETARVEWRDAGDAFKHNVVDWRGEERAGFALTRPDAFAEVATVAPGP
ncbi:MAG TPA: phage major capsid protein [Acidimicrobiales bacterium]|nr:phage major capsid protein [Acidimicrobiales bacterium]